MNTVNMFSTTLLFAKAWIVNCGIMVSMLNNIECIRRTCTKVQAAESPVSYVDGEAMADEVLLYRPMALCRSIFAQSLQYINQNYKPALITQSSVLRAFRMVADLTNLMQEVLEQCAPPCCQQS